MQRGRPKEPERLPSPRKFERKYEDDDIIETWTYDLDVTKGGPVNVNIIYKNGLDKKWTKLQKEEKRIRKEMRYINKVQEDKNKQLPIYKQTFLNPKNGKTIGYTRAKNLGLI